jgi:hypothetical protein
MEKPETREPENGVPLDVDRLLAVVCHLAQHDPPPAIRERLAMISVQSLAAARATRQQRPARWLSRNIPAAVCTVIVAIVCGFLVIHRHHRLNSVNRAAVSAPIMPKPVIEANPDRAVQSATVPEEHHRTHTPKASAAQFSRIVIPLPYSDNAVATGTEVSVPVFISQDELISLGVPMSPALRERTFLADLLLGDDGLPRAISVPLPPGSLVEKR